jgi:PAS domain S-box-containing protein
MPTTTMHLDDRHDLRRYLRDLAALTALPAIWNRSGRRRLGQELADVLMEVLSPDYIYVRFKGPDGGRDIEILRPGRAKSAQWEGAVSVAIQPLLSCDTSDAAVLSLPHPYTNELVQAAVIPIGFGCEFGVIVAVSGADAFPSEEERLLIGVAANQAASVLQRQRAEEAVRQSEQDLADFFKGAPVAVHWAGPDGTILRANQAELNLLGYSRHQYVGRNLAEFCSDREACEEMLRRLRSGEELHGYEARMLCKDGSIKHVVMDANVKWHEGRFVHSRCFSRDITDQKRVEQMSQFLTEVGGGYTCVARFDGQRLKLESASEGFTRVTGYTLEDFNSQTVAAFAIHPADLLEAMESFGRLTQGETVSGKVRIVTKSGDVRLLRYLAEPSYEQGDQHVLRIHGAAQDITEKYQSGERLQEVERQFDQLAENINEVFWIADPLRAQIMYCSPAFETIWGLPAETLRQKPWLWLESIVPEDREHFAAALENSCRGQATEVEYRITRPDGTVRWIRERSFPVKDAGDDVHRIVGVADDFSERKQAALENLNLLAALKESDKRKDEFLAMLAHELRNPLAPIHNSVQIIRAKGLPIPELQWAGEVIERQVQQMTRLVDDLLDVSRITRGKIELRKERVQLATVVSSAVEASRPLIEKWQHELSVNIPSEPIYLDADLTRLSQVLMNLLNNAAKYTEPGGRISLTATVKTGGVRGQGSLVTKETSHEARSTKLEGPAGLAPYPSLSPDPFSSWFIEVSVRDTGIGIPPEMLPQIFGMFIQLDRSLGRAQGGLGIGLTLVRTLVELHGGTVEAHSDGLGHGSEFVVRLPILEESKALAIQGEHDNGKLTDLPGHRRILIVDDNQDAAHSLAKLLSMMGNEVHTAYDGVEAVGAASVFQPDVILLDLGLPKLDGYQAARLIREKQGKDVVLVALTGWGQEDDRRRTREAGFDHHMTKPVEFETLQQLLLAVKPDKSGSQT